MGFIDDFVKNVRKPVDDEIAKQNAAKAAAEAAAKQAKLSPLTNTLNSIKGPSPLAMEDPTKAYTQKDYSGELPGYADLRSNLQSTLARNRSASQDALQRRLAALGNLNSGAGLKQTENLDADLAAQDAESTKSLNAQESQQRLQLQQGEDAKSFQASQTAQGRNYAREQYNAAIPFQFGQFQFDAQSKMAQLGLATDQFDWQKQIDEYTKKLNAYQAGHSGGLFGGGGFLGTGIGAGTADIS